MSWLIRYFEGCVELAALGAQLRLDTAETFAQLLHREVQRLSPGTPYERVLVDLRHYVALYLQNCTYTR